MQFTEDAMRARFHELTAQADAIRAKTTPLKARRDELSEQAHEIHKEMADLAEQFHALERPALAEIEAERAALVRALKGKTGEPPAGAV